MGKMQTCHWKGTRGGVLTIGLEGTFDRDTNRYISKAEYSKGVFRLFGWYYTDGKDRFDWENESMMQRAVNARLRRIVGADREHSLCIVENGTLRGENGTFAYVQFYAKCEMPKPETVQECSAAVQDVLKNI